MEFETDTFVYGTGEVSHPLEDEIYEMLIELFWCLDSKDKIFESSKYNNKERWSPTFKKYSSYKERFVAKRIVLLAVAARNKYQAIQATWQKDFLKSFTCGTLAPESNLLVEAYIQLNTHPDYTAEAQRKFEKAKAKDKPRIKTKGPLFLKDALDKIIHAARSSYDPYLPNAELFLKGEQEGEHWVARVNLLDLLRGIAYLEGVKPLANMKSKTRPYKV